MQLPERTFYMRAGRIFPNLTGGEDVPQPGAPTFSAGSNNQGTVNWIFSGEAGTPTGYQIQTSVDGGDPWTEVATGGTDQQSSVSFAPPGVDRYFRGRATYAGGVVSAWSEPAQASIVGLDAVSLNGSDYPAVDPGEAGSAWTEANEGNNLALIATEWSWENSGYYRQIGYYDDDSGSDGDWHSLVQTSSTSADIVTSIAGWTLSLRTRICNADATVYYGNPSGPLATVVPYQAPAITGANAVDDGAGAINVFVSWDSPPSGDSPNGYDFRIHNDTQNIDRVNYDIGASSPYETQLSSTEDPPGDMISVYVRNSFAGGIPPSPWASSGSFPIEGA